jgi:hypothetical protein
MGYSEKTRLIRQAFYVRRIIQNTFGVTIFQGQFLPIKGLKNIN